MIMPGDYFVNKCNEILHCIHVEKTKEGKLFTGQKIMPPSTYLTQYYFTNHEEFELLSREEIRLALYLQDSGLDYYISYKNIMNAAYLPSTQEEKDKLLFNHYDHFKDISHYLTHIPQKFASMITDSYLLYLDRINEIIKNLE